MTLHWLINDDISEKQWSRRETVVSYVILCNFQLKQFFEMPLSKSRRNFTHKNLEKFCFLCYFMQAHLVEQKMCLLHLLISNFKTEKNYILHIL